MDAGLEPEQVSKAHQYQWHSDSPWVKGARNTLLSQNQQALSDIRWGCTTILVMILEEANIQDIFQIELEVPGNKSLYAIWKLAQEQGLHFIRFLPDRDALSGSNMGIQKIHKPAFWSAGTPRTMASQNHSIPGAQSMAGTPPQSSTTCDWSITSWKSPATGTANTSWPGMKKWRTKLLHTSYSGHEHINASSIHCPKHFMFHI